MKNFRSKITKITNTNDMFNLFKKDPLQRLRKEYDKLMKEAFILSRTNRKLADEKYAEADAVMQKIEASKQT